MPVTTRVSHAAGGAGPSARDDLDLVAILKFGQKRRMQAVDLGADRGIADIGMDRIGEIDRRRAARQRDQAPLRREAEHLIVKQFELGVLQKLLGRIAFGEHFDGPPQPLIGPALAGQSLAVGDAAVLVERMRGNAVARDVLHRLRAHLKLDPLPAGADDSRMDRLIIVLLRRRNIILEAPGTPPIWCGRRR